MDDDITFGASVWATSDPAESSIPKLASAPVTLPEDDQGFDDFDDFGPAETAPESSLQDDDFGDFDDFTDGAAGTSGFEDVPGFANQVAGPSTYSPWAPLSLDSRPTKEQLQEDVDAILAPLWTVSEIEAGTTDEPIREAEGIAQILVTPSSREMYRHILQQPPPMRPPNWTRSRIRRQHLISLGIPINLDEVLPRMNGTPLPTLEIHTRPMSAPPIPRNPQTPNGTVTSQNSRAGTPQPGGKGGAIAQFGPKPELDMTRINKLLQLSNESLTMQPLPNLERHLRDIQQQIAQTSELLTYVLRTRDVLQQDSETYNGLIAELVGEAQKMKSGRNPARTASYTPSRNRTGISSPR